ncbi:serine carboxypeptidase [Hysterangium stoloniferum]|nr:serine carboxypeptidase [Hysterangium stoloniferum]
MLLISLSWVLLASQVGAQIQLQSTFGTGGTAGSGLTGPIENIASLSSSEFTTLVHPLYPAYSVRIKQNSGTFCDETVRSYTGYLDVQARHLFFYFFESRNDPKKDDVILWTNGGPGCSSSLGLLMELGPCRIESENSTVYNPYAWNSKANIIFIDQPVGVGFSYADYGETIETTEDAAQDVAAFMRLFFDQFTEFQGRPFHLAGESYGGRYIPLFGAAIVDDNKKAVAAGLVPVNLVSIMIGKSSGNGVTDAARMPTSYYDIQCTNASVEPFQDIATCVRMKKAIPRCERFIKQSCVDIFDQMGCEAASSFCQTELQEPFFATGRNIYDVSKECEGDISETLCYPITLTVAKFLNRLETRKMLGVHNSAANFSSCSNAVGTAFSNHLDKFSELTQYYVAELLERKVKVLLYIGTYDMICNWVGNERFSLAMKWSGQEQFVEQELRDWKIDGKRVGKTRSYGGLSFVTIEGAGHMVPYDKPVEALELLDRWLHGKQF